MEHKLEHTAIWFNFRRFCPSKTHCLSSRSHTSLYSVYLDRTWLLSLFLLLNTSFVWGCRTCPLGRVRSKWTWTCQLTQIFVWTCEDVFTAAANLPQDYKDRYRLPINIKSEYWQVQPETSSIPSLLQNTSTDYLYCQTVRSLWALVLLCAPNLLPNSDNLRKCSVGPVSILECSRSELEIPI